jgi:hypothetical protein
MKKKINIPSFLGKKIFIILIDPDNVFIMLDEKNNILKIR